MENARQHSLSLRAWHWLDALVVLALIGTFFLREFLVTHSRFLVTRLNEAGFAIDDTIARPIIREMVDQLWDWHIVIGYCLTALFVFRIALLMTDSSNPFRECGTAVAAMRRSFDFRSIHSAGVKTSYVLFYVLQAFMILTGLSLAFAQNLGLSKGFEHTIKEGHEAVKWYFVAFVVAHIAGVFWAENKDQPGIVSAMINGGRKDPR